MQISKLLLTVTVVSNIIIAPIQASQPNNFVLPLPDQSTFNDQRTGAFYDNIVEFICGLLDNNQFMIVPAENNRWHDIVVIARMPHASEQEAEQAIINGIRNRNLFRFLTGEQLIEIAQSEFMPQELRTLAASMLMQRCPKKRTAPPFQSRTRHANSNDDDDDERTRRGARRLFSNVPMQVHAPSDR